MRRRQFLTTTAAATAATALPLPILAHEGGHGAALPAAQRFAIGDITVTALSDGALRIGPEALQGIDAAGYDELMRAAFRDPAEYRSAINAFVVELGDELMLVDAGTGGIMGPDLGRVMPNFEAAGYAPGDVTMLLATHLHPDHIGGAVADGQAVFPNARLAVAEAERQFWTDEANSAGAPEQMQMFFDLARAALDAYSDRLEVFDGEAEIASGITSMPLPGHTPGHTGYMLSSGDAGLLIWADIVHVPPVQFARPDVTIGFDVNPDEAAETRARILDRVVADRMMVAGSHMGFPGLAHVEATADGFRAVEAAYEYFD